jgi:hypothetical protein
MRKYQEKIYDAVVLKKNWGGNNVVVSTDDNVTNVFYYGNKIGVVDHNTKSARFDNCGFKNASTTARINAIKIACDDMNYSY